MDLPTFGGVFTAICGEFTGSQGLVAKIQVLLSRTSGVGRK
jgi:hypothetical protein